MYKKVSEVLEIFYSGSIDGNKIKYSAVASNKKTTDQQRLYYEGILILIGLQSFIMM